MRKFLFSVFVSLLFSWSYSQGFESFDNFPATGTSYQDGTFIGDEGFEWTYTQSRGDTELDGKALMLGRNRTPDSQLESDDISGGIGTLQFSYMQAFGTDVNMQVYVNDELVYTATSSGQQNDELQSDLIEVEVAGDFVLKFYNPANAGQVLIDNVEWTGYEEGGSGDYCIPTYTSTLDYLSLVESVGAVADVSYTATEQPPNGYADETDQILQTVAGAVFDINTTYDSGSNGVKIWIDWGNDGVFDPEDVVAYEANADLEKTLEIEIPSDAADGTYRMRVRAEWGTSADPDPCDSATWGTAVDFTVEVLGGSPEDYCIPAGTNDTYYLDSFVTTGGTHNIDNSGSGYSPGGYGDFYDEYYVSQVRTGSVDFTAEGYSTFGLRIWVDWNQDGVFDTTEEVAWNSTSYAAVQEGTIEVPMSAALGATRMRVVYHWLNNSGDIDPCSTEHNYGEFEDYKFVVEELDTCSGMPTVGDTSVSPDSGNPGSEYTVSVDTYGLEAGLEFQWQSNTNGDGWVDEGSATEEYADYTATAPANYGDAVEWRLALTCTHSGDTAYSTTATFNVEVTYCIPTYTSSIDYLSLIESVGADADIYYTASEQPENGYADETDQILQTVAGAVFDINTTYVGGANGVKIWIDWDNDGEFDTEDEMAYQANADLEKTLEIEIPSDAEAGTYRMRVRAQYGSTADPQPCGSTSWGSAVDFTVEVLGGTTSEYCIPEGTNPTYYINDFLTTGANVNVSNLNSGFSPGGYGDFFDTMTVSQVQGEDVSFEANFMPSTSTFGFRIWVDWNQDGVFDPDTEVAYHSTSYQSSHSGTFTVPVTALAGTTRMRIVNHWLNSQGDIDPCATGFTYGEFEDYKFVVGEMEDCEGVPEGGEAVVTPASGNPGSTYVVSALGYTYGNGLSYQWQSNTDGAGWEDEGAATEFYESYTATAPSELGVEVEWRLEVTCTLSSETAYSETATFVTVITYCIPTISTVEPITRVVFADIDNSSSASSTDPYEDFTDIEGNVEAGEEYPIALEGNTNGSYTNYFTVWVDWNQNGVFDSDEMYEIGSITGSTGTDGQQAVGDIAVPEDAVEGSTRMRVIKNYNVSPTDPCGSYTWGQVEDYTIIVGEGEENDDCSIEYEGTMEDGLGNLAATISLAADFPVEAGIQMNVESFTFHMLYTTNELTLAVYDDSGGTDPQPGTTEIMPAMVLAPSSQELIGQTSNGTDVYAVTVDLPETLPLSGGDEGNMYWVAIMHVDNGEGASYWGFATEVFNGTPFHYSTDSGSSWTNAATAGFDEDGAMIVTAHCETLGLGDVSSFDFSYYPNPVKDMLYIKSAKNIENVRVFNLTGQEIISNSKVSNGQINVNSLTTGVYIFRVMLEGGQVETFKIIKK